MTNYKYYDNEKKKHYHELNGELLYGTSTIMKVFPKVLTYWASGLACKEMGWNNPKDMSQVARVEAITPVLEEIKAMEPDIYLAKLDKAYKAHATLLKDSAEKGTDLHKTLEVFIKTGKVEDERIMPFVKWAKENVAKWVWSEAHCFSEKYWTGGISDVGAKLKTGDFIIIDFKSSKEAYYSQFVQCAGYAIQIEENGLFDKDGNQISKLEKEIKGVCIVPFGAKVVQPSFNWNMEELKQAFVLASGLYKILNKNKAL